MRPPSRIIDGDAFIRGTPCYIFCVDMLAGSHAVNWRPLAIVTGGIVVYTIRGRG
jgi:hypothetical protein